MAKVAANINKASFTLRFLTAEDREFAFNQIANLPASDAKKEIYTSKGATNAVTGFKYDHGKSVRALIKIGINSIAAFCKNTLVDKTTFPQAVMMAREEFCLRPEYLRDNGFVHAEGSSFGLGGKDHLIRLVRDLDNWHVYFSFFGQQIGAYVVFRGPSGEDWRTADIVAPFKSDKWSVKTYMDVRHPIVTADSSDHRAMMPSLQLQYSNTNARTEERPERKPNVKVK